MKRYAWDLAESQYREHLGLCSSGAEAAQARFELASTVLERRGCRDEAERELRLARDSPGVPRRLRAEIGIQLALVVERLGRPADADVEIGAAETLIRTHGLQQLMPKVLRTRGTLADRGGLSAARDLYEASLALFVREDDAPGACGVLNNLGNLSAALGRSEHAERYYREAVRRYRSLGNRAEEAAALSNVAAEVHYRDTEAAERLWEEALAIHREVGDKPREAVVLANLSALYSLRGEHDRALPAMESARDLFREQGNLRREADVLCNLGINEQERGDLEAAEVSLSRAREVHQIVGYLEGEVWAAQALAENLRLLGQFDLAIALADECRETAAASQMRVLELKSIQRLVDAHSDRGELEAALFVHSPLEGARGAGRRRAPSDSRVEPAPLDGRSDRSSARARSRDRRRSRDRASVELHPRSPAARSWRGGGGAAGGGPSDPGSTRLWTQERRWRVRPPPGQGCRSSRRRGALDSGGVSRGASSGVETAPAPRTSPVRSSMLDPMAGTGLE